MRVLRIGIFYGTKTQTTDKCAKLLAEKLPSSHLINLDALTDNVDDYDFIIIGASVRLNRINKKVRKFIKRNKDKLYNKKTAYFLCNAFTSKTEKVLQDNIDPKLFNRALIISSFGGEIDLEKQKGLDRIIVKLAKKLKSFNPPQIDHDAIEKFAIEVKQIGLR